MTSTRRASAVALLSILLVYVWYTSAAENRPAALAGTYVLKDAKGICRLELRRDLTYKEDLESTGETKRSDGKWRQLGESGIIFSGGFLPVTRQQLDSDGAAYGWFGKILGFFPYIRLAPAKSGPVLRRSLF
jgi:hypothetical protein